MTDTMSVRTTSFGGVQGPLKRETYVVSSFVAQNSRVCIAEELVYSRWLVAGGFPLAQAPFPTFDPVTNC